MNHRLSPELSSSLSTFAHRKLEAGELCLLAQAIASTIPLAPAGTENISLFTLTHRRFVDSVIFALNDFSYVDEASHKHIHRLVDGFSLWRYRVAHDPVAICFTGEPDTVIDDISALPRFIDKADLCGVADIAVKANHVHSLMRQLCAYVWLECQNNTQ